MAGARISPRNVAEFLPTTSSRRRKSIVTSNTAARGAVNGGVYPDPSAPAAVLLVVSLWIHPMRMFLSRGCTACVKGEVTIETDHEDAVAILSTVHADRPPTAPSTDGKCNARAVTPFANPGSRCSRASVRLSLGRVEITRLEAAALALILPTGCAAIVSTGRGETTFLTGVINYHAAIMHADAEVVCGLRCQHGSAVMYPKEDGKSINFKFSAGKPRHMHSLLAVVAGASVLKNGMTCVEQCVVHTAKVVVFCPKVTAGVVADKLGLLRVVPVVDRPIVTSGGFRAFRVSTVKWACVACYVSVTTGANGW